MLRPQWKQCAASRGPGPSPAARLSATAPSCLHTSPPVPSPEASLVSPGCCLSVRSCAFSASLRHYLSGCLPELSIRSMSAPPDPSSRLPPACVPRLTWKQVLTLSPSSPVGLREGEKAPDVEPGSPKANTAHISDPCARCTRGQITSLLWAPAPQQVEGRR